MSSTQRGDNWYKFAEPVEVDTVNDDDFCIEDDYSESSGTESPPYGGFCVVE